MVKLSRFDAAEYLDDLETQAHFINAALEHGDPDHLKEALATIARAHGMSAIADESGITRQGLYKALSDTGDPRLSTLTGIMKALGLKLLVAPG